MVAIVFVAASGTAALAQHNADLWPGQQGGRLAWSPGGLVPGSVYHPLTPVDTFLHGWSANNPGFEGTTTPRGGVLPLGPAARIWLRIVSLDPALFVIDNALQTLENPGDQTFLGGPNLHTHLTWFIDRTDPGFNPDQCVWEGTFKLIDLGSGLGDSPSFTLLFTNVPVRGGEFPPAPAAASGDFDGDRDVDVDDYRAFLECLAGPDLEPSPNNPEVTTCKVECLNAFDFADDRDVDMKDFAGFQAEYDP